MSSSKENYIVLIHLIVILFFLIRGRESKNPLIIGGRRSELGSRPYQVSFQHEWGLHFCGGSIINHYYILSAAHCTVLAYLTKTPFKIIAGTIDNQRPASVYYSQKIILHHSYVHADYENDICLVKANEYITYTRFIRPVKIPQRKEIYADNQVAIVSGFGYHANEKGDPEKLRFLKEATVYLISNNECRRRLDMYPTGPLNPTNICYLGEEDKNSTIPGARSGACKGDSGGPLTVDNTVVGIVSWGADCGDPFYPEVNTRVDEYIGWIKYFLITYTAKGRKANVDKAFNKGNWLVIMSLFPICTLMMLNVCLNMFSKFK